MNLNNQRHDSDSLVEPRGGKKSSSAAALHEHTMIVGKAGIETVDSRQVSHLEMIDDLRDSALYFQENNILSST